MDQRVKGGTPPTTNSTVDPTSASEDSEVSEKKRWGEGDADVGQKEEEKRGSGKKREGDKGAVLELLIEGRCGSTGQQQLQISGRETSCPEGNVRLRIGLQAKRTKKPPKILESYVCKPTIRTYQRQARGGLLKGDGEGGQQNKNSSTPVEATRDQRSALDAVQTTFKQNASAASPPLASSSLSSSPQPASTTASKATSVPSIISQGTKSAKQVPVKLADKTEVKSNGSSERVKKDKLPNTNGQTVNAGQKPCSPTIDQTVSSTPSTTGIQVPSAPETRNEGKTSKKHNGLVQTTKQKGLSNGKCSAGILGTSTSSKSKVGKQSSSSSVSSMDSSAKPPVSISANKELSLSNKKQDSRPLKKRKARRPSWTKLRFNKQLPPTLFCNQTLIPKAESPHIDLSHHASRCQITPARKRGRPKTPSSSLDEPPPKLSPNAIPTDVPLLGCDAVQKAPVLEPSPKLQCAAQSKSSPKKRGRPPKQPVPVDQSGDALNRRNNNFHPSEQGNRQLKIRRLINEMKKRKKKRLHKVMLSGYVGKEGRAGQAANGETSLGICKSIEATTVNTLSALSSSFGSKLGPQINVSKRGTIYMGKRRGRKPKAQTSYLNSKNATQSSLFTTSSESSLFSSNQPQPPSSHPFPSPSLTHSSGAQSPYSEGSLTEPTSSLLFPHSFSLPSPSSSCTSPRPPSSSSLSPFVKKSCPCQGRHHFPFHQSSCKLSCPTLALHHTPGSPSHLKEATPSPRSESHSEETLPSDSGIGTDNNSVSERAEKRGVRGMFRLGQGSGVILGGQKHLSSLVDRPSPVSSPLSLMPRHTNPISNSSTLERHRDKHRHRRRDYDCSSAYSCLCPCPGHNKCTHSDFYPCLGHNALKRQKNKHKKKHQQLHMQDPEFMAELEDLIGQFSEVHIGRRSWARTGLGQGFDGSGNAPGGRRHHSPSHSLRSNIFRINLNGFYSPHPSSYAGNPSFSPQPFYPCQPLHCNRKQDRRQCGCPSKFQDTIDNMGFYSGYPPATTLYHHLPSSYQLPSPHQYSPHQSHHAHFLLNPARFHRRRSRLLREGALGGEAEGDMGGGSGGGPHLSSGFTSSLSCGCGRSEHKHKHKHRHRHCERDMDDEEELPEDDEEDRREREVLPNSNSSWKGFSAEFNTGRLIASDGEDEDGEDESNLYRTSPSPTHTNLFTSAAVTTGGRGLKSGLAGRNPRSGDRSWRRDEPAWTERRGTGLQGDSRSRGQQKNVPTLDSVAGGKKRRPGRPRKNPLPSAVSSPTHSSAAPFVSSNDHSPGHNRDGREAIGSKEGPERERGGDTIQQVTEVELQARRKKRQKRKHGDSPCQQSVAEDKPKCDTLPECFSHSDLDQAPSPPETIPREESEDEPPGKTFLRAGLYSDDYKTIDPPSQAQQSCTESMEDTSGDEREYSLLPAPINVGKYLRLKRMNFQLPYDVMWLWQNNQLHSQPAVPLKRKRRYCRLKMRSLSSHQTAESSSETAGLYPHLDLEPLTSVERSFVVKHHVFLVRNLEMPMMRKTATSSQISKQGLRGRLSAVTPTIRVKTPSSLTASPCPTKTQQEEEEEEKPEEEVCTREQRRKRLNDLLLTLQHS
ncbi:Histone-lysine N-methyltransferase ASH1L [Dissostichus eleginoides]|uniref:Histone-lysine N-methyltransferase ASH1L n=1 Tax=Dissostichus eleginoides TaxID=100907 RepID=A0AAD9FB05_DISEL|nr:Histone-lysine N-methyltransferase ASH1L [Dissostichus eleginoides]